MSSASVTVRIPIIAGPRVNARQQIAIRDSVTEVIPRVDGLLHESFRPFMLRLYGAFPSFSAALQRADGLKPQGSWDTSGNIVRGVLVAMPGARQEVHRFAHIYTEWVLDRLTNNKADREPSPAWLYDGLAEVVADRVSPVSCRLGGWRPIALGSLSSPAQWLSLRGSGAAGLEYCEAEIAARHVVRRLGWNGLVRNLHRAASWSDFAHAVLHISTSDDPG